MNCFHCDQTGRGVCHTCGIALCEEHGSLVVAEQSMPTENSLQRVTTSQQRYLCEFDR